MADENKGIYLLIIMLKRDKKIKIGALGTINFKEGFYYYIGSAQNNLQNRIERHSRPDKKFHWHIDYFLNVSIIIDYYTLLAGKRFECKLFNYLKENDRMQIPVIGFGSSDCKCPAHFLCSKRLVNIKELINEFKDQYLKS